MALSDDFRALGLAEDAAPEEVRRAWRAAAPRLHPDLGHPVGPFLDAKAAMERCLAHSKRPRRCEPCRGEGRVPVPGRSLKTAWADCGPCGGKGEIRLD